MTPSFLEGATRKGSTYTNKCEKKWECQNKFPLVCGNHGENLWVPCGRWKTCVPCRVRKSMDLKSRFLAGIREVPSELRPMFVTLTFSRDEAPEEDEAHKALRSLVAKLRYRGYLGAYGWVLQRQGNGTEDGDGNFVPGTLHYHGIFHLPWLDDDLKEWRKLVEASGFGRQQNIKLAKPRHAGYVSNYLSSRLARLNPVRRAYSFSRDFPRSPFELERKSWKEARRFLKEAEVLAGCDWLPAQEVAAWLR